MTELPVQIRGLTRSFGRVEVLRGVDLEIPSGSVVGLLGRNGEGKSTLLKCLLGLLRRNAGEVSVFGRDSWELDADTKARIGYVPQDVDLHGWFTVEETLNYVGSFYPLWNPTFVADTARAWGLDLASKVKTLSRGQTQKLGILLALGHEPELLVLDEPAASLDPSSRREFLSAVLERVADLDQTVLFSTHITSDVERIADRVAVLKGGRIRLDEDLDDLKSRIKRIRLIARTDLPRDLSVDGALNVRVRGNEASISLPMEDPGVVRRLESTWGASAEIEDLNLEEIFLELHRD